jgi:hypothetical protein
MGWRWRAAGQICNMTQLTWLVFLPSAERSFSAYCFSLFALASAKSEKPKKYLAAAG